MKNKKLLIIVIGLLVLGGTVILISVVMTFLNAGSMSYNADLSELDIARTKIYFARREDCETAFSSCDQLEIYEIFSDGTGLKQLHKSDPEQWQTQATNNTIYENMGFYDGNSEIGNKKIEMTRDLTSEQLMLAEGGERKVLERRRGFIIVPGFGIDYLKWMSDKRHLIIEDDSSIGIYDTESRRYAYLTDGFLAIPWQEDEVLPALN